MQKVIIKKLGPIEDCEIEIKPFTILIGESGSGKSIILRTISLLKWVYKKMQYKNLLKASAVKSDSIRLSLDKIARDAMLDDYLTKDSYIELQIDNQTIISIKDKKLKPNYKNISTSHFLLGKIVFLNENRTALAEILSTAGGRKAKFSYYTDDMIDVFYEAFDAIGENFSLHTVKIKLNSSTAVGHKQFLINRNGKKIKFEHASSGEKNASVLELISYYFSDKYELTESFNKNINALLLNNSLFQKDKMERLVKFLGKLEITKQLTLLIEEPESNLFPSNQRNLTYFLSSLQEMKNNPEVIFSTHSPYILTVINNLLYSYEIAQNNELSQKINAIVPKKCQLNIDNLSAYAIKNGKAESIIDKETKLIDAEYIDHISDELAYDFNKMCGIFQQ
ncbi:MAG: ATP-binding protein [Cardiobacteriaceae bacterium]|nr:ATP-binding protein [Cardiobacteriaceae bacterium]